ncbi:hypothetical protein J437_LFUL016482, partial [Ladona fulva]
TWQDSGSSPPLSINYIKREQPRLIVQINFYSCIMRNTTIIFFAFLACILLVSAEEAPAAEVPCVRPCTRHFQPVCGKQGRKSRQFSNACMWKNHNCENTEDAYPDMEPGPCPPKSPPTE